MNLLNFFRKRGSAPVARERLQILLAHERTIAGGSDLVGILREEILAVIKKHVQIDQEKVQVTMERGEAVSTLAVDIEIPTPTEEMKLAPKEKEASAKEKEAAPKEKEAAPKEKEKVKEKDVAVAAAATAS